MSGTGSGTGSVEGAGVGSGYVAGSGSIFSGSLVSSVAAEAAVD